MVESCKQQPGTSHGPNGPLRTCILWCTIAPEICVVVTDPAWQAVHLLTIDSRHAITQRQAAEHLPFFIDSVDASFLHRLFKHVEELELQSSFGSPVWTISGGTQTGTNAKLLRCKL